MLRDLDQESIAAGDDGDVSSNGPVGPVGLETSLSSKRSKSTESKRFTPAQHGRR